MVLGLAVGTQVGCAEREFDNELVVKAVDATTPLARRFVYTVEQGGETFVVQGIVEDDFRYSLQLTTDEGPGYEQIVDDDAVAVRFLDPDLVEEAIDEEAAGAVELETDVPGASVIDALAASRWVLDERGAPGIVIGAREEEGGLGFTGDPVFDARTALEYVRQTAQGTFFELYDPDALEPTYRPDEDPFAAPEEGSGVLRYDSFIEDLPAVREATQGGTPNLPGLRNFRRMAVYVKEGRIIRVEEYVGLTPRTREDLIEFNHLLLEQANAPQGVIDEFDAEIESLRDDLVALDDLLLAGINSFRELTGDPIVQFRHMILELQDFDDAEIRVTLPSADVIRGDLAVLRTLGRKPASIEEDGPGSVGVIDEEGGPTTTAPTGTTVPGQTATSTASTTTPTTAGGG